MTTNQLPDTLRRLRLQQGLTQAQVAEAVGTIGRTYSNWETGDTEPAASYVCKLAKLYNCTTDHLLGLAPHPTALAPHSWVVDLSVIDRLRKAESSGDVQLSDTERRWAFAVPARHAIIQSAEFDVLREEVDRLWHQPPTKRRRR